MISESELLDLIANIESDRVERTESIDKSDKFSKAICAFSNDLPSHCLPGYLLIGVKKEGRLAGLKISEQQLEILGQLRSGGNIQPLPSIAVQRFTFKEGDVAVVEVLPSDLPPVRYKGQVWIRIGPTVNIASEQEERILIERRHTNTRSYDTTPVMGSTVEDISLSLFTTYRQEVVDREIIDANHRSIENQLASLRFFDSHKKLLTIAGVLLFGKNPRFFIPGAYIQYLRFEGTKMTDLPIEQAEISGDLLSVLRELDTRVKSGIISSLTKASVLQERLNHSYPEIAIREIMNNAILHRDYTSHTPVRIYWFSDRIEIQSPGGTYGGVTANNLEKRNSYRNPVIAEAMKGLGYVNRFGYGIQRAQSAMKENGNPPLDFEIDHHFFLCKLRKAA